MLTRRGKNFSLIALTLMCAMAGRSHAAATYFPKFSSCAEVFNAPPGTGVAYRGMVRNDDYHFSALIPEGFTGWGGGAQDAPYHGFALFLGPLNQACISVEMHIRVEDDEAPVRPKGASNIQLGLARGFQYATHGDVAGVPFTSIHTAFTYKRINSADVDDGDIALIVPTSDLPKWRPLYDAFLTSVKFGQ